MKMKKIGVVTPLAVALALALAGRAAAQTGGADTVLARLSGGIQLYGQGLWDDALRELRQVKTDGANAAQEAEAYYWIGLSELALGDYLSALRDLEAVERADPTSRRVAELAYHRGRACYFLGRFDEALVLLKRYDDGIPVGPDGRPSAQDAARKAQALYWMGECLFSLGRLDQAEAAFLAVTQDYPQSAKYEAASYRVALIGQKRVEAELLGLLKWSHEESLKTVEEYQKRERSYEQALIAFQKRIADIYKEEGIAEIEAANTRLRQQVSTLERENAQARQRLAEAEQRIRSLETELREALANRRTTTK